MTHFEFLSIAASIVLALGLGKLISSLPYVFSVTRFDLAHSVFFTFLILGCLFQWWQIWPLNTHDSWEMRDYLLLIFPPITFYLSVQILVSDSPKDVENWKVHFLEVHRWFLGTIFITWFSAMVRNYHFLGSLPNILGYLFGAGILLAWATGKNRIILISVGIYMVFITLRAYWTAF